MLATLRRFLRDDSGATAIEYGLIAAIMAAALVAALGAIDDDLSALFTGIGNTLNPPPAAPAGG